MDLKTCRWMTRLLYVGCLALAIIALPLDNQILRMGLLGAALALALMVAMVRDKFWRCPKCGNTDQDKMNVARRTCGYIGTQFWNQGRTQEIKERVLHL